jgi:PqqD family protein of HPr-rel-A system
VSDGGGITFGGYEVDSRFCIRPSASLHWAGWDDEYVVFDETSGQTHQLDVFRAYVLNTLTERSQTRRELMDDLQVALAASRSSDLAESLDAVLNDFERYGLIDLIHP